MKKVWWVLVGAMVLTAALVWVLRWSQAKRVELNEAYAVLEYTEAQLALITTNKDSLAAVYKVALATEGEVVAGVRIVTRPDTVYVPVEKTPTQIKGWRRYASLTDTTTQGFELTIKAESPPFPEPLHIGYTLTIPSFKPQIGFIRGDSGYTAVVTWEGMDFTVDNAIYIPQEEEKELPLLGASVGSGVSVDQKGEAIPKVYLTTSLGRGPLSLVSDLGWSGQPYFSVGAEYKFR